MFVVDFPQRHSLIEPLNRTLELFLLVVFPRQNLLILLIENEVLLIEFLEQLIKDINHFHWEVHKLMIQLPIKLLNMPALNIEHPGLEQIKLIQLRGVDLLGNELAIRLPRDFKLIDEGIEIPFDLPRTDVGAVDGVGVVGGVEVGGVADLVRGAVLVVGGVVDGVGHAEVGTGGLRDPVLGVD